MKRINLTGKRFGRLTVISFDESSKKWLCKCDCGNQKLVSRCHLMDGHSRSCGCLNSEITSNRNYRHGFSKTRLYKIYYGILQRCNNQRNPAYPDYGGRGIHICKEWSKGFEEFRLWAMSHGYSDDLSIDRIDVNGNYCPENCRWATQKEQCNNTRKNIMVGGLTLKETCIAKGLNYNTVYMRIKRGCPIKEALTS